MKGVIRVRKDLKKAWFYVRWYDEKDGEVYIVYDPEAADREGR